MVVEELPAEAHVAPSVESVEEGSISSLMVDLEDEEVPCQVAALPPRALWVWEALLKDLKALVALSIECPIGPEGCKFIAEGLRTAKGLECLNLRHCGVRWQGAEAIANALAQNESLLVLDLSFNSLGHQGVKTLVRQGLEANARLTRLHLAGNHIGAKGVEAIATLLESKKATRGSVVELDLSQNQLEFKDVRRLGTSLREDQSLQVLDLSRNELRSDAVYRLGSMALAHSEMRKLDMRGRRVASSTAERLLERGRSKRCQILMGPLEYPADPIARRGLF